MILEQKMLKSLTIHMKTEKDKSNEGRTYGQSIGELGRKS
jgi:hypothetical protein